MAKKETVSIQIKAYTDETDSFLAIDFHAEGSNGDVANVLLSSLAKHLYETLPVGTPKESLVNYTADFMEALLSDLEEQDEK